MKRNIITLVFALFAFVANAQNVTITGRTNQADALMRLFVYEDLVNETGLLLDQNRSDKQGSFILEGTLKQILPARIYVGLEYVDLVLSPNATYDVDIIIPKQQENVSYFEKDLPTLRVKPASDQALYR